MSKASQYPLDVNKKENMSDEDRLFSESCINYLESMMDISEYDISLYPTGIADKLTEYWKLEVYEFLTDMYFSCVLPKTCYKSIKLLQADQLNDRLVFYMVYEKMRKISLLSDVSFSEFTSGSGRQGYGLGLI